MVMKNLVIDTNLLLLLVIGSVENGRHIQTSKRLGDFDLNDYDVLLKIIATFDNVCITPYIATEISNLIDLKDHALVLAFKIASVLFSEFKQINVCIEKDCSDDFFLRYGITDASLIGLANTHSILTNDNRLLPALFSIEGADVIPFEALRVSK